MPRDVFEEDPFEAGAKLAGAAGDLGPQVPLVVLAKPLAGGAERLAGVSRKQGVDPAGPGPGVEGAQVGPDRRGCEIPGALACDDAVSGVFLPFDKASGVESGLREHEPEIETAGTGAERKAMSRPEGMNAHIQMCLHDARRLIWETVLRSTPKSFAMRA